MTSDARQNAGRMAFFDITPSISASWSMIIPAISSEICIGGQLKESTMVMNWSLIKEC